MPRRIQRKRTRGWRMPEGAVAVTRGTAWGNPFRVDGTVDMAQAKRWGWTIRHPELERARAAALVAFEYALAFDDASKYAAREELRGRDLACWCALCPAHADGKPMEVACKDCPPCHADVLLRVANEGAP